LKWTEAVSTSPSVVVSSKEASNMPDVNNGEVLAVTVPLVCVPTFLMPKNYTGCQILACLAST